MIFRNKNLLGVSGGASELMQNHALLYESVSISDRYISESLALTVNHRAARHNERVHCLTRRFHSHLLGVFFPSASGPDMEFKQKHHGVHGQAVILCGVDDRVASP